MGEKPILFSGPMVRAIREGRKTQTRRIVRLPVSRGVLSKDGWRRWDPERAEDRESMAFGSWVYGRPGDRLWVRETWGAIRLTGVATRLPVAGVDRLEYRADGHPDDGRLWRPSIHMPRWASRLTLEVVSVRVERLQEVSEEDAQAEGVTPSVTPEMFTVWDDFSRAAVGMFVAPTDGRRVLDHRPAEQWRTARENFAVLWDSINGQRAPWASNPWVWAVEFKRVEAI